MPITLGSNIASLKAQRQLAQSTDALSRVFERLSSGQRINRASDDPAGLGIASCLQSDARVFAQGVRNVNDGVSAINIAEAAISELSDIVIRIRELAEQAANGTFSKRQRASLDREAQQLSKEYTRVAQSTEFNGRKLLDGSFNNTSIQAGAGTEGALIVDVGGAIGTGEFDALSSNDTPTGEASALKLGDVNGDGVLDAVVSDGYADSIFVMLGRGDGSFGSAQSYAVPEHTGALSPMLELGDFTGDGNLDIATAASGITNRGVSILVGLGDGTFAAAISYGLSGWTGRSLASGDFNGDGKLDLAAGGDINLYIALGGGDGTISSAVSLSTNSVRSISTGDVNGDGAIDLLVASYSSEIVRLFLGNGDGSFEAVVSLATVADARAVKLVDVNGDDTLDAIAGGDGTLNVFLGNGDGSFRANGSFASYPDSLPVVDISSGDLNGDGLVDLVASDYLGGGYAVLIGDGAGAFQATVTIEAYSGSVRAVELGDVDGDGVYDLVAADYGVSVGLGRSMSGAGPLLAFSLATVADARQAVGPLDRKLTQLSTQRGEIGAYQSRLGAEADVLFAAKDGYLAASSRITDADIAGDAAELARMQILQHAASAILAQANQRPRLILQLLQE